jgi:hypothetical protein
MLRYARAFLFVLLGFMLLLSPTIVIAQTDVPFPAKPQSGFIIDELGWFNPEQAQRFNTQMSALRKDTGAEIMLVLLQDCGNNPENFKDELLKAWNLGQVGRKNGLIFSVCWYHGDRDLAVVQVAPGDGVRGTLPDSLLKGIKDRLWALPKPEAGIEESQEAIRSGIVAESIISINAEYAELIRKDKGGVPMEPPSPWFVVRFFGAIILGCALLSLIFVKLGYRPSPGSKTTHSRGRSSGSGGRGFSDRA